MLMTLRSWIPEEKLQWPDLCENPNAISLIEKNPEKINWVRLSSNLNAIHILEQNHDKLYWGRAHWGEIILESQRHSFIGTRNYHQPK